MQLIPKKQAVLREAKASGKEFFYIWTNRGEIYARKKTEGSEVVEIQNIQAAREMVLMVTESKKETIREINKQAMERWERSPNGGNLSGLGNTGYSKNRKGNSPQQNGSSPSWSARPRDSA